MAAKAIPGITMIVYLGGGLANQMFQYAFGRSVSIIRKEELFFEKTSLGLTQRAYGLDAFNIKIRFVGLPTTAPRYQEGIFHYDPEVYTAPKGTYFLGCWQTEKYFNGTEVGQCSAFARCFSDFLDAPFLVHD